MATYQREVWVNSSFWDVWDFYSTTDGLEKLTPGWMNLRVEGIRDSDGEANPDMLGEGTQIRMSVRPFGVGERQRWTSTIIEREEEDLGAMFRDEMSGGPFPEWEHTTSFSRATNCGRSSVIRWSIEFRCLAKREARSPKSASNPCSGIDIGKRSSCWSGELYARQCGN